MDCCCCLHELPSLAKPTYAVLSATQAENWHQTAPAGPISTTAITAAAMQPKTIGMGPVSRFLACCLLPAKAKANRARDIDCFFAHCGSNPRLLDLSQARYHCTSGTAGVMQHHYPIAYMKYRVEILFLVPAAYRFPVLRIFAPDCGHLGHSHMAGHMYCWYCTAAWGCLLSQRPFNSLCGRRCAPGIKPCVAASCASSSGTCCQAVLPMLPKQPS